MLPRELILKSMKNQRKVEYSDPFTIFRALSLRKESLRDFSKTYSSFFALQRHPSVRPHPHGRCVCIGDRILVSSPSPSEIERADREILGNQVKIEKREGSRRLTVVQGVSQRDPKSEISGFHSFKAFSAPP